MSGVLLLMYNVWCLIVDVQCLVSYCGCTMSGVLLWMYNVCCLIVDVQCLVSYC